MTAISHAQAARLSGLGRSDITAGMNVDRTRDDSRRQQFERHNVTSRTQEFAGGFVDFLLGRGAHHPR